MKRTYNEDFMQEMVRDYPMEFLGEDLTIWKEFLPLEGFVPDLVFLNKNSNYIIVELQTDAIDRNHLYRSVEYRDLLKEKENVSNVEIILVANSIKEHHKKLLKIHNIKPVIISKDDFVKKANKLKPKLKIESKKDTVESRQESKIEEEAKLLLRAGLFEEQPTKYKFIPVKWTKYNRSQYYLSIFHQELFRLRIYFSHGRSSYDLDNTFGVIREVESYLSGDTSSRLGLLQDFARLRVGRLCNDNPATEPYILKLDKTKIQIVIEVTTKGNLSVTWYPPKSDYEMVPIPGFDQRVPDYTTPGWKDWEHECSLYSKGYSRPKNELMFIRGINFLSLGDQDDNYAGLAICIVKCTLDELISKLKVNFHLDIETDIELQHSPLSPQDKELLRSVNEKVNYRNYEWEEKISGFSIGDYKVNFDLDLETDEELSKEDSISKYEELLGKKPKETND